MATENVMVDDPDPEATAPRSGVLLVTENADEPAPLMDATSKASATVNTMLAAPDPEAIRLPVASATVNVIDDVPVVVIPPTANAAVDTATGE